MTYKFFIAFLFVAFAIIVQVGLGSVSGVWIDVVLAALITAAFFVDLSELILLISLSVFILNWQPAFSLEMLFLAVLPIAAFFFHKRIPFKPWLANVVVVFLGILILYLLLGLGLLFRDPAFFLWDTAGSLLAGIFVFQGLWILGPRRI